MNYHSLGDMIAKIARKNISIKASIADDFNVASFHLLLVQQTLGELIKDLFIVRQLKIWMGDASCKGRPHVEHLLFTVVLNVGVFMNSDGQKSWRSHDFLLYQQNLQSTRKNLAHSC